MPILLFLSSCLGWGRRGQYSKGTEISSTIRRRTQIRKKDNQCEAGKDKVKFNVCVCYCFVFVLVTGHIFVVLTIDL